jgi:RNA polymerase sigma-70 factor (ECF subfamily)
MIREAVEKLKQQQSPTTMSSTEFYTKFDQMSTLLHSFAYNLTKNVEDAKDLFQETAFRALTNRDKFRPGTNFKAWLFTIMKNIFINNYRKKVKANTIMDSTDNMYYINSGSVVISNKAESNIMMKELKHMIEELDDSTKIPFLMHYQGYKYQEIADHLDLPLGTVKSRIFFARKELKDVINKRYDSVDDLRQKIRAEQ